MFTNCLLLLLASSTTLTTAALTGTQTSPARTTHTVVAGRPGLRFDPDNIVATPGSIIEFHFLPANHSVVESSFASPCVPKDAASFYSGFFPIAQNLDSSVAQSSEVFQIEIQDDKPIWFYYAQEKGRHC
jgi:plastocyanin